MKLSVCVLNHISRAGLIPYLKSRLGDVPIQTDFDNDLIHNSRLAWCQFNREADYHLVIEDDAIIGDKFYERLEKILTDKTRIYSLYWGNVMATNTELKKGYKLYNKLCYGVAVVIPTNFIFNMLMFANTLDFPGFDTRISKWCQYRYIKVYYPLPSLVDHRHTEKSLTGHNKPNRFAKYF